MFNIRLSCWLGEPLNSLTKWYLDGQSTLKSYSLQEETRNDYYFFIHRTKKRRNNHLWLAEYAFITEKKIPSVPQRFNRKT
jgi:hypothetical protein